MLRLPEELDKGYAPPRAGGGHAPGSQYFVFRKPFLINIALTMRTKEEKKARILPDSTAFHQALSHRTIGEQDVFLGIAGLKSLDLLSLAGGDGAHYQHAVLFDVNHRQVSAMKKIIDLIKRCKTRQEFIEAFPAVYLEYLEPPKKQDEADYHLYQQLPAEEQQKYFNVFGANKTKYQPQDARGIEALQRFLMGPAGAHSEREHSWLSSEEHYQRIHAMVKKGQIAVATMDLRDSDRVQTLKHWLELHKLRVGDMYISSMMSFMDPQFRGDYFNKDNGSEQAEKRPQKGASASSVDAKARAFYRDLIGLMDKNNPGHFLVSIPNDGMAFMQDYHLESWDTQKMIEQGKQALRTKPQPQEKIFDNLFTAGGMAWRLLGFRDEKHTQYYRIFSEMPVDAEHIEQLQAQVAGIDRVIENINPDIEAQSKARGKAYPPVRRNTDIADPGHLIGMSDTLDHEHFAKQERRGEQFKQHAERGVGRKLNVMLSSQPFRIPAGAEQDPADSLNVLEEKVIESLNRGQGTMAGSGKWVPEIVVSPRRAGRGTKR